MKTAAFDEAFRRRVISNTSIGVALLIVLGTALRQGIAPVETVLALKNIGMAVLISVIPFLVKKNIKTQWCGLLLVSCITLIALRAGFLNGGVRAPATALFLMIPLVGFFSAGFFGGVFSVGVSIFGIAFLWFAEQNSWIVPLNAPEHYATYKSALYIAGALGMFGVGAVYEWSRRMSEKLVADMSLKSIQSAKMAALGEMAAGVAHEINNPLTIISGFSHIILRDLAKENPDLEKIKTQVQQMEKTTRRIETIVKGLKTFSVQDEASAFTASEMSSLIHESVSLCGDRFATAQINLKVVCDPGWVVNCKPVQISQVILNLLGNAFDAVEKLEERWVVVEAKPLDKRVVVSVTDSGRGIAPKVIEKMMEPFFTTKEVGKGTGLGLSISLGIAKDHRGTLTYDTRAQNTRFVLELPV